MVFKRDDLGFPSFWQLQVAGCAGLYLLDVLSVFPYRNPEEFYHQTIFCATLLVASSLLRPVCRSLLRRSLPWVSLELRAFAWAAAYAAAAAFLAELVKMRSLRLIWPNLSDTWLAFCVLFFLWSTLYFSTKQWQQAARERARLVRAESEARQARLSALRYQLSPHFLFNSLNAVSTLILEGNGEAATQMLARIGELLRTTLGNDRSAEIPLSQELAFIEQYLAIEQTRLGDRLRVSTEVAENSRDALVPSMLLQPLVENAVRHGVAASLDGGIISIETIVGDDRLMIRISNSGPKNPGRKSDQSSNGIGLANTAARLATLYGDNHRFSVAPQPEGGYEVRVEIPIRKPGRVLEEQTLCAR